MKTLPEGEFEEGDPERMPETTETPKKTKAPARPRATAAAKDGIAKATTRKTAAKKTTETAAAAPRVPTHEEIARLAEQYWAERGHTDGHAEQDWLRAERELMKRAS